MNTRTVKRIVRVSVLSVLISLAPCSTLQAQTTPESQMEKLGRGVVVLPNASGGGRFISWRFLGTDNPQRTTFDLLRNGTVVKSDLTVTNYKDTGGSATSEYQVVVKVDGQEVETTAPVKSWDQQWFKLPLELPAKGAQGGDYFPNDCSVGDVDGDGEYELFLKWDPSTAKDNSQSGVTDNVYIDCYKINYQSSDAGSRLLWRIDLGRNIRAGAHYTQFMVYDFDGDGRAEMICKTAPGSKDGLGNYVNQASTVAAIKNASNTKSWVNSNGKVDGGHEYLTVFNGETGAAIHTIAYNPNRNAKSELSDATGSFNWDDRSGKNDKGSYGNRGERYLGAVACLDGPDRPASAIFCRGYYTYAFVWAVDFDGQQLKPRWLHRSDSKTQYKVTDYTASASGSTKTYTPAAATGQASSRTLYGNGNHNLSLADVDGDGCDEIIWGSAALDNDGTLLYATGFGHGDAIHAGKMIPGRDGLQVFQVHEEKGKYAWDLHDAATGEILFKGGPEGVDNGRGMAAQLSSKSAAWWFSSASDRDQRSTLNGSVATSAHGSVNFRMYWDGTVQDALLDGNKLDKFDDASNSFKRLVTFSNIGPGSTCNSTKNTPNLVADILGDWREELILYTVEGNDAYLGIYTTNITTAYTVPTLMHDHTYRMAICWQNTAYNQPPHLGYNLAEATAPVFCDTPLETTATEGEAMSYTVQTRNVKTLMLMRTLLPDGTQAAYNVPEGFERTIDNTAHTMTISGTPTLVGDYLFAIQATGLGGEKVNDTLCVHVLPSTGIESVAANRADTPGSSATAVYDLSGRKISAEKPRGIYIIRRDTPTGPVVRKITR